MTNYWQAYLKEKDLAQALQNQTKGRKLGFFPTSKCLKRPLSFAIALSPHSPFEYMDPIHMRWGRFTLMLSYLPLNLLPHPLPCPLSHSHHSDKDIASESAKSSTAEAEFVVMVMSKIWKSLSVEENTELGTVYVLSSCYSPSTQESFKSEPWANKMQLLDLSIPQNQRKAEVTPWTLKSTLFNMSTLDQTSPLPPGSSVLASKGSCCPHGERCQGSQ